jgi:medium-chain acyl-[acyl-carrier-protein] hydrolase
MLHGLNLPVIFPRPHPCAKVRLFCFPYAGGGASIYRTWPAALPPEVEMGGVQLPGRESRIREQPLTRMDRLVESLAPALATCFDRPFVFFGHSMGALVAFELARELRRQGLPCPSHLLVSGRVAPQIPIEEPPVCHLPDVQFIDKLRLLGGMPDEVLDRSELIELLLPALRADFALHETYVYVAESPLSCRVTGFGGKNDGNVLYKRLAAWRVQTIDRFDMHILPGNHFFLRSAEKQLLNILAGEIAWLLA